MVGTQQVPDQLIHTHGIKAIGDNKCFIFPTMIDVAISSKGPAYGCCVATLCGSICVACLMGAFGSSSRSLDCTDKPAC